ncbi:hypothetical protein [Sebaldella sp. S0638]|uniref:hypothetical protein n=1 Tax=Sebaldella sp. S0638 TaxID=2957809 RepID=UPI0020A19AAE|nr:hypothetical protein [Sebaldella sp. S0638]MCP1223152.1 hypothetical protein [Sebaldella sp. S0638]
MDRENLIREISDANVNIEKYTDIVLKDEKIRREIVNQMLTHKHIMVYYHCYYILDRATSRNPELFYNDWKNFEKLLDHDNSYHRTIGLVMISNLIKVDKEKYFDRISDRYFMFINDEKITTARDCVVCTGKILKQRSDYIDKVIKLYLDMEKICKFKENQKALLLYDMFVIFDEFYEKTSFKKEIDKKILDNLKNSSPKTRKKANELKKKYSISER